MMTRVSVAAVLLSGLFAANTFPRTGFLTAFRRLAFRDGSPGEFWLAGRSECRPIGSALRNEGFLAEPLMVFARGGGGDRRMALSFC
jgi:hypothetical protein